MNLYPNVYTFRNPVLCSSFYTCTRTTYLSERPHNLRLTKRASFSMRCEIGKRILRTWRNPFVILPNYSLKLLSLLKHRARSVHSWVLLIPNYNNLLATGCIRRVLIDVELWITKQKRMYAKLRLLASVHMPNERLVPIGFFLAVIQRRCCLSYPLNLTLKNVRFGTRHARH